MCAPLLALARVRGPGYAPGWRRAVGRSRRSCQTARRAGVPRPEAKGLRIGAAVLLGVWAFVGAAGVPPLRAQAPDITVVGTRAFRPTAVLLPHFQFWVAVDSVAGGLVLKNLTINPVTFTGWVRVEGIQTGARQAERRPFPDSVRFAPDGRVTLLVADSATGAPLVVEPQGDLEDEAGRLVITAPRWPYGRAVLVTIDPADLYESRWRSVGYAVRDRVRVDDRRQIAFLDDSTVARTVIAIGPGQGTKAAILTETTSILVAESFDGAVGRDRVHLPRLVFALDPARTPGGGIRAELVFALGKSEAGAAAELARASDAGPSAVPEAGEALQVVTPLPDVATVLAHVLGAARPMLRYDRIGGLRNIPAGSYTFLAAFDRDGWYGATTALQLDDPAVVCAEYTLFKLLADPSGAQRHEIWNRLGHRGPYIWTDAWGGQWLGDKDPYEILKGYACYRATRDTAWLGAELPNLRHIARFMLASDRNRNGLVEGRSDATYSEMSPLDSAGAPYRAEDPYVNALAAYALDRLAELEDEAAWRLPASSLGDSAAVWRAAAGRIRAALPRLWRPELDWFTYHATPDGARSWDHDHLQAVDVLDFGAVTDTAIGGAMLRQLLRPRWWDAANSGFFPVPIDDPWHDRSGYWTGWDWHILDFKALEALLRFGTVGERREAWHRLGAETSRIITANYGRPGERGDNNGLFMFSAGSYLDLLAGGLFGVEEHLDEIDVRPHLDGIADLFTWRLQNWRTSAGRLSVTYRPADSAATFHLTASRHGRLVLRFPWLGRGSCMALVRGAAPEEHPAPIFEADGSVYVNLGSGPTILTVSARACGS
jgi:hypothetical protein